MDFLIGLFSFFLVNILAAHLYSTRGLPGVPVTDSAPVISQVTKNSIFDFYKRKGESYG